MKILAIDTSNDEVIDELNLEDEKTHSENLMPLLDKILKKNNIALKNIKLIACSVGPGSFTGIRIGIASIKPIAEVLCVPVASVTSLETLAKNIEISEKETIVSLIDARNNQVYCGIFSSTYQAKEAYLADDIHTVLEKVKAYHNIIFVGNGAILHQTLLKQVIPNAKFSENNKQSAVNVGKLGYQKYQENNLYTADTIAPIYLRKSQAERQKDKNKK